MKSERLIKMGGSLFFDLPHTSWYNKRNFLPSHPRICYIPCCFQSLHAAKSTYFFHFVRLHAAKSTYFFHFVRLHAAKSTYFFHFVRLHAAKSTYFFHHAKLQTAKSISDLRFVAMVHPNFRVETI